VVANDDFAARGGASRPAEACAVPAAVGQPSPIKHVLYFIKENRTYDQVFGDIKEGNGDPKLVLFGKDVTPNEHAIARQFVLLDNLYCDSTVSVDGHEWCKAANVTDAVEKTWPANYGRGCPLVGGPVYAPTAGYIWDACKRAGKVCKVYFGMLGKRCDQKVAAHVLDDIMDAEENGNMPDLMVIHLPCDHTMGTTPGMPTPKAMVADNDLALGRILEALSKSKFWATSVLFAVEDDAQDGPDHVDAHRTVAVVAGPYVKRGIVDSTMYDQCSIVRTIELILGLPPMSQFDAAATPMFACFSDNADLSGYERREATWSLDETNKATAVGAKESARMDFSEVDRAPWGELNRVLWHSIKGPQTPYPKVASARGSGRGGAAEEKD
jgi:Phosphoesterase family